MKIYLAGKITGNKNAKEDFEKAEQRIKYLAEVFNPEKEFRNSKLPEKEIMFLCLKVLSTCDKMILLSNYKGSKGTRIEIDWCLKFDIPIFQFAKDKKGNLVKLHHAGVFESVDENNFALDFASYISEKENVDIFKLLGTRTFKEILLKDSLIKILHEHGLRNIDISRDLNIHHATVNHTLKKFEGVERYNPDLFRKYNEVKQMYLDYTNLERKAG